jgi:hypothetical protein
MDYLPQRSEEALVRQATTQRKGRTRPANLREQVNPKAVAIYQNPTSWPTPTASDSQGGPRQMDGKRGRALKDLTNPTWPTPSARDHKGGYIGGRIRNGKVSLDTLDVAVQHVSNKDKKSGTLNPDWVEWLMGVPTGWTDLGSWGTE